MFSQTHLPFGFFQKVYTSIMASKQTNTHMEVIEKKEDQSNFTLFDIKPIQEYQAELAKKNYYDLIKKFPQYPHAYVALADSLSQPNPAEAIDYYDMVLEMCPYFPGIRLKRGILCEKLNDQCADKNDLPYKNLDMPTIIHDAKKAQERENNYRRWYHTKIRKRFFAMGLRNTEKLTQDYAIEKKMPDWTDPTLSNGAVKDAYMGTLATKVNDIEMAKYFLKTAIVKYPHDVSSLTNLAAFLNIEDMEKGLYELNKYIDLYEDYDTYYARALLHIKLDNIPAARSDMRRFITTADKFDMANLAFDINCLLNLLYDTDKKYTEKEPPADYFDRLTRALDAQQKVKLGDPTVNYESEIQNTSYIIDHFPFSYGYYAARGFLYYHQGNYAASLLDYSMALLLIPEDQFVISDYYYGRARSNLALGEILEAQLQFHKAMEVPPRFTEVNIPLQKSMLQNLFCNDCIKQGTRYYENGNFYLAEKIFSLGFLKSPSAALCYHAALTLGVQNKYDEAIDKLKLARRIVKSDKKLLSDIKYMLQVFEDKKIQEEKQKKDIFRRASRQLHKDEASQQTLPSPTPAANDKKKKHRHKKAAAVLISIPAPIKKQSSTSEIQAVLNEETKLDEIAASILENEDEKEIQKKEELDELQRKKRNERKKMRRQKQRAQAAGREKLDQSSDDDTDLELDTPAIAIPAPMPVAAKEVTQLELLDIEKLIFAFFKDRLPSNNEYMFFMVGGWAYDRVRQILCNVALPDYNDIDLICDIPPNVLMATFPELKGVPEVENLFVVSIAGHKIDLVYRPNLKNLYIDAKTRDFLTIYISDQGVIHDPTGFGIIYMRANKLKSAATVSELFQRDPLTMLRGVYTSLKRSLIMTDVKQQIKKDKKLLVPFLDPSNPQAPGLLHPVRINITLKKNFSQKRALCNFNMLYDLGVIDVLFPQLSSGIKNDIDWIRKQFKKSDEYPWPKLEIIYANFIAASAMAAVKATLPVFCKNLSDSIYYTSQSTLSREQTEMIQANVELAIITKAADEIFSQSLLISACYKTRETLNRFLPTAINQWKEHWRNILTPRPPSSALPITDSAGKIIEAPPSFSMR